MVSTTRGPEGEYQLHAGTRLIGKVSKATGGWQIHFWSERKPRGWINLGSTRTLRAAKDLLTNWNTHAK